MRLPPVGTRRLHRVVVAGWYRVRAGRTTDAPGLHELRPAQARQLLEAGGFGSVAAVADAVGFASAKHFGTVYA